MKQLLAACFLLAVACTAIAQEAQKPNMPPKVLVISREFVKPGRTGAMHDKTEAAFVQAFASQNWPTHYLAVDSLSGKPRSLFLIGYDSFDAWEKDALAVQKNTALNAALQRAGLTDADLLADMDGATFQYREDLSLRPGTDLPHMRYFEISRFQIRPGHEKDWERLVKLVAAAWDKTPDVQWATYEVAYGSADGTFIVFTPRKSGAEIDHAFTEGKDFESAMGEDGMKQLRELSAAAIESSESNLFAFNPRMSYVSAEFTKADPDFWGVKPAVAHAKKKAEEAKK
jgi:hypothetical protein